MDVRALLGTVVAPLAGCGGSASGATADTLPEPAALTSSGGQLSLDLFARYGAQPLRIAGSQPPAYPGVARTVQTALRSFNGQYMAPTLHLQPGDTLRIRLVNELPANVKGQSSLDYLNHQNSTNLHFHGLHVDPREIRPGVFGDYVVDMAEAGVLPGASRQHEVAIPADHTNGIYWYHPHLHGSSNVQVSSGMFGAILIHDPKDTFIDTPDIRERAIHVHKVNLTGDGKTESFYDSIRTASSGFLLNGAYQPTIVMRPGEVQQWHFINTASFYPFNPVLDGHTLWAYAKDGNVFNRRFKPINAATSDRFDNAHWPGNALYPGNRHSIVVKASDVPGTYYLRSVKAPSSEAQDEIVARIVVEGTPLSTPLPQPARLPRYAEHLPITDEELAAHGGKQRSLVLAVLPKTSERLAQPIPVGRAGSSRCPTAWMASPTPCSRPAMPRRRPGCRRSSRRSRPRRRWRWARWRSGPSRTSTATRTRSTSTSTTAMWCGSTASRSIPTGPTRSRCRRWAASPFACGSPTSTASSCGTAMRSTTKTWE